MIILRDAPALLVVASTSVIMQWLGAVVLGLLGQPEAVAGYSVAMRLSIIVSIIHSAVTSLFAPRMAAAHTQSDVSLLRRLSHRTSLTVIALAMPALSALFFFAPFWLSLFGQEYTDYTVALRLLVTGQIVAAVIGHSGTVLVMAGAYNQARTTSLSAAVAILLLMVMLVPWGGPPGQHLPCRVPLLRGTSSQ
jgi:O-antigen/teichoic acid export membrane protein